MRLLLDQGVPQSAAGLLRAMGHQAVHTNERGLSQASGIELLSVALSEASVIVTFDADFHGHLALSGAAKPSVIRLRVQGLKGTEVARLIALVLSASEAALELGAMVTVDAHGARLRRLPISELPPLPSN